MDLQTDIRWIKNELEHVSDPYLIKALKNILQYHKNVEEDFVLSEEHKKILDDRLAKHQANPKEGSSWEQVKERIKQRL